MNAKKIFAAVAVFAAAGSAFADNIYPYVDFSGVQSTKSRAEVKNELQQARAEGSYVTGGREFVAPDANFVSTKSRAQVMAELEQSKADGSYAVAHQEFFGQYPITTQAEPRYARTNANADNSIARSDNAQKAARNN